MVRRRAHSACEEMSSYDNADYYKDYYGVIIVRTLLFLAALIWMQHLMVWRASHLHPMNRKEKGLHSYLSVVWVEARWHRFLQLVVPPTSLPSAEGFYYLRRMVVLHMRNRQGSLSERS